MDEKGAEEKACTGWHAWKGENDKKNRCKRDWSFDYSNITDFGNIGRRNMYRINRPSGMNYNGVSLRQRKKGNDGRKN